jgi:hypothetical protein
VVDVTKFPDLASQNYLESRGEGSSGMPVLEPTQWILGIYNTSIMNLLDVPHFGRGKHINACIKQLLACMHGIILWMDRPVCITVDLNAGITWLPTDGEKPEQYLEDKTRAKAISDEIKAKYGAERGNRGIGINDINDLATRFSTRFLGCKLMHKCRKEGVSAGVVVVMTQCAKGSSMSWAPYLLNSFLEDCKDTHD